MDPNLRAAGRPALPFRGRVVRLLCVVPVALAGCRSIGKPDTKYDLLTAEIRTRDREIEELRGEVNHLRLLSQTYQRQQPGTCVAGPSYHPGADTAAGLAVRDVSVGSGTGGVDDDGRPGDESLMVVVVPRDGDGTAVKVPARVTVTAFEVSRQGQKTPIGKWDVPPDQLRRTWKNGLLTSGYFVPLQWDQAPGTDKVRVLIRFTTADGRDYEADKDVTVRPLPGIGPHAEPAVSPPAVVPPGVEELPPPAARMIPAKPLP